MGINKPRWSIIFSPTGKAVISLVFSLTVLGTAIFFIWQNIVVPFRSKPARPNFETISPTRSP